MLKVDLKSDDDREEYIGTILRDEDRKMKLITRLTRDGVLDGFRFSWEIEEDKEREYEWSRRGLPMFIDVKYVFDRERCITKPLSKPPPYDWFIEILQEENEVD